MVRTVSRGIAIAAGLGVLALILAWFAGAFDAKIPPARAQVDARRLEGEPTAQVHLVSEHRVETSVGTVQAAQHTEVASLIPATILDVAVRAGALVSPEQVLVVLDSRDLQARVDQAREAVRAAQANAERAQADLDRYQGLTVQGVVSQAEFDQIETAARVAAAEVERALRALEEAQVGLTHAEIRSPIAGQVVDRLAEPGDRAAPGEPLLRLYNPAVLRLEAPVREGLATTLRVGQPLRVNIEALSLDVSGEIEEIVPQAEVGSRSMLVKVRLPDVDGLYRGMFGRLMVPAGERQRLCVPLEALEVIGQLEFVEVVKPDQTLERRLVVTGEHSEGGSVEVLSGLASGESVVLRTGVRGRP